MASYIWFVNMYNISLFRISINYTSDVGNFNPFLPPANDVPIPANRTGFLSFMTNSLRTVMTTATINKSSPRMLKARTSSNQPVIKSSSDCMRSKCSMSWTMIFFPICLCTSIYFWCFLFWIKSPCLFGYGKHESFSIRCTHLTTMISY